MGYQRIAGELKRLGLAVSPTTARKVLASADLRGRDLLGGLIHEYQRAA